MNERIKELAEQAGYSLDLLSFLADRNVPNNMERFAELIIRECAEVCYHHSIASGGVDTAFGYGYKDCGNDIKRHFGVEE